MNSKLYRIFISSSSYTSFHIYTKCVNTSNTRAISFLTPTSNIAQSLRKVRAFLPSNCSFRSLLSKPQSLKIFLNPKKNYSHSRLFSNTLHTTPESIRIDRLCIPTPTLRGLSTRRLLSSLRSGGEEGPPLLSVGDVAAYITDQASSVLVMAGAGISTASGIPDFRSELGKSLYGTLSLCVHLTFKAKMLTYHLIPRYTPFTYMNYISIVLFISLYTCIIVVMFGTKYLYLDSVLNYIVY